jgi:hypothetical protein
MGQSEESVLTRITVEDLIEPSPGVYYPSQAVAEGFVDGVPLNRSQYAASGVTANDTSFSDGIFMIEWPSGTVVEDKIANKVSVVSVESQPADEKTQTWASLATNLVREAGVSSSRNTPYPWAVIAGAGIVGILAVVVGFCSRRKR